MRDDEFKEGDVIASIGENQQYIVWKSFIGWYEVVVVGQKFNGHGLRMSVEKGIASSNYVKVGRVNKRLRKEIAEDNRRNMPHG